MKTLNYIFFIVSMILNSCGVNHSNNPNYGKVTKGAAYTLQPKVVEQIALLDSIQYVQDALLYKGKTYVVGYTFYGPNSRFSQIVCVDNNNRKVDWIKTVNTHDAVELNHISLINDKLYITGAGGLSGVVKDSLGNKIAHHIDLNTIIVSISLNGKEYVYKEIEGDNARFINSAVIKHNDNLFLSYSFLDENDWRRVYKSGTKIIKFDEELDIHQSVHFFNGTLTRQNLYSVQNRLHFVSNFRQSNFPRNQLNSFTFNEELIGTRFVPSSEKYEFNFSAIVESNKLNIVSIGHPEYIANGKPNYEYGKLVVSEYHFRDGAWSTNNMFYFNSDSTIYVADQNIISDNKSFYAIAVKKEYEFHLCKLKGDGIELLHHFQIGKGGKLINIKKILMDDSGKVMLVINENDQTKLVRLT